VVLLYRKNGEWILENLTDKDHIRGALKAKSISTNRWIKAQMGWDTVDELLCKFYWKVVTPHYVKHLKPTGANYNKTARYKQGEHFTRWVMVLITAIASAKLSFMKKKPFFF
jgi:hypothetical protein